MMQGYGRLTFANGDKFEGFFVNNRANGKGTYSFRDNQFFKKEGTWKDNKFVITIWFLYILLDICIIVTITNLKNKRYLSDSMNYVS